MKQKTIDLMQQRDPNYVQFPTVYTTVSTSRLGQGNGAGAKAD